MAEFDESKVINALHTERAEIGKKYYFNNMLYHLKKAVEEDDGDGDGVGVLDGVFNESRPFEKRDGIRWEYLYPYEEPPKKRMTNRQLAEWLAKGNGEYTDSKGKYCMPVCVTSYSEGSRDEPVREGITIRTWDSEEWVEPTVDIYERDCDGKKHENT